jgi:hypothetical protein
MLHDCFADEIAIDFPSVGRAVERMRDAFLGEQVEPAALVAQVSLSRREASGGPVVPIEVPLRETCADCGGRGETWEEPCERCAGTGESLVKHALRITLPPGIADGARVRFRVTSPDAPSVRVELHVSVRSSVP